MTDLQLRTLALTDEENTEVDALLHTLSDVPVDSTVALLHRTRLAAQELPLRIRTELTGMRLYDSPRALVVTGFRIDDDRIGPTPVTRPTPAPERTRNQELLLLLHAALLGEAFAWATQQNGRLVHDVLPIPGEETEQMGSSSKAELLWHTEDAFHPLRCDYVGLLCLRNHQRAVTTLGWPDLSRLAPGDRATLLEPRYLIRPDTSHTPEQNAAGAQSPERFSAIAEMDDAPERVAVLFGDPDDPYLRIDPAYMSPAPGDAAARRAYDAIAALIEDALQHVALAAGSMLFVDNYQAVHGRKPFAAAYDGRDRWLKRVNITRDLRRSRSARQSATSLLV
ncbi:guanitoxin biosynthesis L-enduracididine beta-hydroxylase GntD [Streptomyces sp. Go-475]|uniref:guanitoxin biosynthesis L-enduracididine beta-hydroxylase GntD n=1 Tax=Streptomyces sp. Go-475 TaxID=2072505 RepID=UPI000DEEFFF7|nr:guanitoxin biosynthesis L-enduracididine beta-hydroxylase GntD [Streptomyces sp. Go-475]AXE88334.1 Enduracididine beta-hydroxylase [Streptomyces sp. Go-475]